MPKKICVITGSRAEYGILKPLLTRIDDSASFELNIIVTGLHLLESHGLTINEIVDDGFQITKVIDMYQATDNDELFYTNALARGIMNITDVLRKQKPDMIVVFGDRIEPLAAALAAAFLKIPIIHIHGGDKTDSGHIDECTRHSISRFANIHFTAIQEHSDRLIRMGEEPWRIHTVGALGLDSILYMNNMSKAKLSKKIGFNPAEKVIVCLFHSVPLESQTAGRQMEVIISALMELKIQSIIIYPNNDAGSKDIIDEIEKVQDEPFVKVFKNLSHSDYIHLLRHASVLIGNSSSGMIEAPSLNIPTVNIGNRNVGRIHGENMLFIKINKEDIIEGINKAIYDVEFIKKVKSSDNPYGDGKTSEKIVNIIKYLKIDENLLRKQITY